MSWDEEITQTADALAALLRRNRARLEPAHLDVALTARTAILAVAAQTIETLAPRSRTRQGAEVLLSTVERDPVEALGQVLAGRTRPAALAHSPSELLDTGPPSGPGGQWARAGRHALLAEREWPNTSAGPLDTARAWQVIADAGALAEAVAVLDHDILAAATAHPEVTRWVQDSAGLRIAAHETVALASAQPPSSGQDPGPEGARRAQALAPLSVPAGSAAPEATRRLAMFIEGSEALTPHQVRGVVRVTRSLCVVAAGGTAAGAGSEARDDLHRELGGLARALHQALDSDRGEAALTPVPAGAVEAQLRELLLFTRRTFAAGPPQRWWTETRTPRHLAQAIPAVVDAVHRHTAEQVAACRWAVHDLDERTERTGLRYAVASTVDPDRQSPLLRDLAGAAAAAGHLRTAAGPPGPSPAQLAVAAAPAHRVLTDAIRRHPIPRPQLGHPARPGEGPPPRTR